jgi:signal transduction histidine kinase
MFVFVVLYAAVLSIKFSRALTAEERMTQRLAEQTQEVQLLNERLQELNRGLEAGIAERMNELRQTNEHLAQQAAEIARIDGARRQLLSNISHELRTPMTSIRGYVEALLDNVIESPSEQRHYLRLILNKMIGLGRLISDLFELSKLESGHPDLQFRSLPARLFLERTREKYELDVVGSGLHFEWEDGEIAALPDKTSVVLDTERIDQVLTNLIANAVRSTPPGGTIRLKFLTQWGQRGGEPEPVRELVVQVEDTGAGIDEGDLPFIFERFYKGNDSAAGGAGLGLAIAKEIVAHHGGKLWVESEKGRGSTFGFTLLLYEETETEDGEGTGL